MKKKKMIAFGMALSLLCASMSGRNVAQATSEPILGMSETVSSDPLSNSEQAELVLSQDGKTVVDVKNKATATQSIIPDGVTSIGEGTFSGCENLRKITIPKTVISIGECAFERCRSLESISIPKGVTSIGDFAFSGCKNLKKITIPKRVKSIAFGAFSGCTSLESVILPKSVEKIDGGAFSGCIGLKSITIPKSVKKIGKIKEGYYETPVFENCYMMKENVKNNSKFDLTERGLTIIDRDEDGFCMIGSELVKYRDSGLKNVTIPQGVTKIGDSAFEDRSKLESITIPESVTSIGERAFSGCVGLTNLTVPNGVVSIGPNAFVGVSSIEYHGSAEGALWGAKALNGQLSTDYANTLSEKIAVPVNN